MRNEDWEMPEAAREKEQGRDSGGWEDEDESGELGLFLMGQAAKD